MKYAMIDISSASVSLLIADDAQNTVVQNLRESCVLSHYLEESNLTDHGIEKLIRILSAQKEICIHNEVQALYVVSTAGMRVIDNAEAIRERIHRETGLYINSIDGKTEAYCDYLVNHESFGGLMVDIGGATVELCNLAEPELEKMVSLPIGPFCMTKFVKNSIHPSKDEAKKIREYAEKKLKKSEFVYPVGTQGAVLVGATGAAIYEVYADYFDLDYLTDSERIMEYEGIRVLGKYLVESKKWSMLVMQNAPERMHTLTTAVLVLCSIMKQYGLERITISERGVKEGYWLLLKSGKTEGIPSDLSEIKPVLPELPKKKSGKKKKEPKEIAEETERKEENAEQPQEENEEQDS